MNPSMRRGLAAVLAIWLAASACQFLTGVSQAPTIPAQDIAYTAAALALTAQASAVPAPVLETAPPPTSTVEPAPTEELTWFPSMDSHCRAGPGIQYESLTMLWSGQRLAALGTDESGNWIQVRMQLSTNTCWTRSETGNLSGQMSSLSVISIPDPVPTATMPRLAAAGWDIAVLRVGVSSQEDWGIVYMDIRNNGPDDFSGTVRILCGGKSKLRDQPYTEASISGQGTTDLSIGAGMTGTIDTTLKPETSSYSYPSIQCAVAVPKDTNPDNNIGVTSVP